MAFDPSTATLADDDQQAAAPSFDPGSAVAVEEAPKAPEEEIKPAPTIGGEIGAGRASSAAWLLLNKVANVLEPASKGPTGSLLGAETDPFPIRGGESQPMLAAKQFGNTVNELMRGGTSADGITSIPLGGANIIPGMLRGQATRISEADKTPAGSPERWRAALSTVLPLLAPAVHAGAAELLDRVKGEPGPVTDAASPSATFDPTTATEVKANAQEPTPEEAATLPIAQETAPPVATEIPPASGTSAPITEAVPQTGSLYDQVKGAIQSRVEQVKDAVGTQSIPKSIGAGIGDEVIQHAAARTYVPHLVDDMLAKVFPDEYKDPEAMSKTIDVINKDNVLGGYDDAKEELAGLRQQVDAGEGGETAKAALEQQEQKVKAIEDSHDLTAYDKDVQAAKSDPVISGNIDRWEKAVVPQMNELYNELKGVDPELPQDSRGRHFDARINLLTKQTAAEMADWSNPDKPMPQTSVTSSSSYRNPNVKYDKFVRQAKLTGDYSTDAELSLLNSFGPRWNEATKLRLYNAIADKGVGKVAGPGEATPEGFSRLAVKMPETSDGRTQMVEKNLFVPKDMVEELRTALGTDMPFKQHAIAKALTQVQLLQLADATAHTKNIHTVVINALGHDAAWKDIATKIPFVSSAAAIGEIAKVSREISADTPAIRSEVSDMAKRGMIRPDYPPSGIQKITKMQGFIHDVDTAARVIMNRRYTELVNRGLAVDTAIGRRNFVQQIGEYNRRLMGRWEQSFRDKGLSPFIVAGRTFNRFGKRLITGDPGFEATSTKAAIQARAAQLTTLATAATLPALVNMFTTGSILGRQGTPIGAIDLGPRFDGQDGKRRIIDVFQLTGIRRGLRSTGINAAIEGVKNGQSLDEIAGNALSDAVTTAAHPWIGPALGAAFQTFTGKRLDLRSGWQTTQARNMGGGGRQYLENARVALKQQNPLIYAAGEKATQALGLSKPDSEGEGQSVGGALVKTPLSAVGYKEVDTPAVGKMKELLRAKAPVGGYSPDQIARREAKGSRPVDPRPSMFKRLSKDERAQVMSLAGPDEAPVFNSGVAASTRRR